MTSMKILQVNTELTWRGGERQTFFILKGLKKLGHTVSLLSIEGSPISKKANSIGVNVIAVKNNYSATRKIIQNAKYFDIVHAQTGKAHTQCFIASFFVNFILVYTRRVSFKPSGFLTRLKYKKADCVISISRAISQILNDSNCYKNSPVVFSSFEKHITNHDRAKRILSSLKISDRKKIIGIVASLDKDKDPYCSINVCEKLSKLREDFIFIHFGKGNLKNELSEIISQKELTDKYILMGHVENVEDFFPFMDVFLMTSKSEGLGSSVLDAFMSSVPVVSSDAGGLAELVDGRGYICKVSDSDCFTLSIIKALGEGKSKYASTAKAYCIKNHSSDEMVKRNIEIYKSVLENA